MNAVSDTVDTREVTVESVRQDFPLLQREVHGKPLVYLDNAATAQKPKSVIDVIERYYREENANIHRGVHYLSETATEAYEQARLRLQELIGAPGGGPGRVEDHEQVLLLLVQLLQQRGRVHLRDLPAPRAALWRRAVPGGREQPRRRPR